MLMTHARYGYTLQEGFFYCSQVPTSREQVNLVGANIKRISVGDAQKCRDRHGISAMEMLREKNILDYS
jgi:hypothetical protein